MQSVNVSGWLTPKGKRKVLKVRKTGKIRTCLTSLRCWWTVCATAYRYIVKYQLLDLLFSIYIGSRAYVTANSCSLVKEPDMIYRALLLEREVNKIFKKNLRQKLIKDVLSFKQHELSFIRAVTELLIAQDKYFGIVFGPEIKGD